MQKRNKNPRLTKRISIKESDQAVYNHLDSQENISAYLTGLVKRDMGEDFVECKPLTKSQFDLIMNRLDEIDNKLK